jgi:hypothetical protein
MCDEGVRRRSLAGGDLYGCYGAPHANLLNVRSPGEVAQSVAELLR